MPIPFAAALPFLPKALAVLGGIQGFRSARQAGASGLGQILGAATGAFGGYNLGSMIPGTMASSPIFAGNPEIAKRMGVDSAGRIIGSVRNRPDSPLGLENVLKFLRKDSDPNESFSPARVAAALGAATYFGGAFDQQPTDIFMPGYNMSYLDLKEQRPKYTFIDPATGQEVEYQSVYAPEEAGRADRRIGPYSFSKERLKEGGLAEVKKFNEGGINYLPSKMTHDENDSNNYVRATGYVEDGAGVGDKDEDTMLAQLADGEFVTRADGVLGAGIIAGANPNSMKDMREKGAEYFYEQQRRYKRVFDLLKDRNGNSKQKIN